MSHEPSKRTDRRPNTDRLPLRSGADAAISESQPSVAGKVAIVTGALGLLGREHCVALASAGASVVVTDLDATGCREFSSQLAEEYGGKTFDCAADIRDPASLSRLLESTTRHLGVPEILVNNAALNDALESADRRAESSRFERMSLDLWQRYVDINITGTFLCCQILGGAMAERGRGTIINIASTYGVVAPDQSLYQDPAGNQSFFKSAAYPVTKGAVIALTRFLAAYWGESGVRVNSLSPGAVENGQDEHFLKTYAQRTPMKRLAQPGEYRGALVFLASDASTYMTGANLVVDGGWTIW